MNGWSTDHGPISHPEMMRRAAQSRVVLLGERHDQADIHRWQLHCASGIAAHRPVVLGFEMFPARLNPVLAAWVAGDLSEADFLARAEWSTVWGFPAELYLPLFSACREMGWPMVGLNVARSLVKAVGAVGWEGVPGAEREGLTPARPSAPAYREFIFRLTRGQPSSRDAESGMDPKYDRFVRAQEVWDRAFATHLAAAANRHPDAVILGIIGMGHLQFGGGVSWQLADFGITHSTVLLPVRPDDPAPLSGAADGYFALRPEPTVQMHSPTSEQTSR